MLNYLKRLFKIIDVFSGYFWQAFIKLKGCSQEITKSRAILLRYCLERLGSVFIKFGQFLSLRPDLIPPEYCRELFYLLENVPPFSENDVIRVFQEEFNTTPEKLFPMFKMAPVAAASFGQVHEAYLKSGEKVAVKVQRPKIKELVSQDIRIMNLLAKIIDILPLGPNKLKPMIDQFEGWTLEELNYETEANYTEEFYNRYKENSDIIIVPKIYRKFCSKKILTAEFIEGITLSNILLAIRNKDKDLLNRLSRLGFSRSKVAETLLKTSVKQIYFDGFFHADPHPANIIFTPDRKLSYIDFGIVGTLDKKSRFACLRYTRSVLYGDTATAFEALTQLCDILNLRNIGSFKKEHDQIILETLNQVKNSKGNGDIHSLRQIIGRKLFKTMRIMQKYGAIAPPDTLRYFRALSTLDSTVLELNPEMEISDIARKFRNISIANLIMELPSLVNPKKFEENLLKWLNLIEKEIASNG